MILLAEDHAELRSAYQLMLKLKGFPVVSVENGQSVLDALGARDDVQLIILDIGLPDISGLEVLARIRASETLQDLPVIVHSAYADSQDKAMNAGATAFVRKDGDNFKELLDIIRSHVLC